MHVLQIAKPKPANLKNGRNGCVKMNSIYILLLNYSLFEVFKLNEGIALHIYIYTPVKQSEK